MDSYSLNKLLDKYEEQGVFSRVAKEMAKDGKHCKKCGLWLPNRELKKGINCPECKTYNKI